MRPACRNEALFVTNPWRVDAFSVKTWGERFPVETSSNGVRPYSPIRCSFPVHVHMEPIEWAAGALVFFVALMGLLAFLPTSRSARR
jgi:hypothetical protein